MSPKHAPIAELSAAGVIAAGVVLFVLGGALQNFFAGDDGHFLDLVTRHAVPDYFFDPAVTATVSGMAFSPWNALPYSINLGLFGFEPKGYYAHQLAVVWLAAVASYALLRRYVGPLESFAGVALFLTGIPTADIANQLMTGHYAYGLLFAILGVSSFVHALRGGGWPWALAGAFLYFLAAICKEIYVPLPLVLCFLPEGKVLRRIRYASACIAPGLGYLAWRRMVIGSATGWEGGDWRSWIQPEALHNLAAQIVHLPLVLFGEPQAAALAIIAMLFLLATGLRRSPAAIGLVIAALAAMLMPLVPLMTRQLVQSPDRYCYVLWWGLSMGGALLAGASRTASSAQRPTLRYAGIAAMATMVASMWWGNRPYLDSYSSSSRHIQAVYRATLELGADERMVIVRDDTRWTNHLLDGAARALDRYRGNPVRRDAVLTRASEVELVKQGRLRGLTWDPTTRAVVAVMELPASRRDELFEPIFNQELHHQVHVIRPPYLPRIQRRQFEGESGNLDRIAVEGNVVVVEGWVPPDDYSSRRLVHVGVPSAPLTTEATVRERLDPAQARSSPQWVNSGFQIRMSFQNPRDAEQAAAATCVVFQHGNERMLLVSNRFNERCRDLVR